MEFIWALYGNGCMYLSMPQCMLLIQYSVDVNYAEDVWCTPCYYFYYNYYCYYLVK